MSKRARADDAPREIAPSAPTDREVAPEGADKEDTGALAALAAWCDDHLREIGEMYTQDDGVDDSPLADVATARKWVDDQFDLFVDALGVQQSMELSEAHRGVLADVWRKVAADTTRVYCMRNSFAAGSRFIHGFHLGGSAVEMCREIDHASSDIYEEWTFALGWKLARSVMEVCTEEEKSEAEDEPVEESSSDDGAEEDESESEDESSDNDSSSDGEK